MSASTPSSPGSSDFLQARTAELFDEQQSVITRHTDHIFSRLMICQWLFAVLMAVVVSPYTWIGAEKLTHIHIWAAIFLGGAITAVPVALALLQPGKILTRQTVAIGQMLMSALLIHLTGGHIETHFHVFGSLAILAFYRDWRVLVSATVVVFVDHLLRGFLWPQSVYGDAHATIWRSFEHAGWVIFEVTFLIISIRQSRREMNLVAERQAKLEALNDTIELTVTKRTAELAAANKALQMENAERDRAEQKLHTEYVVTRILAKSPSWDQAIREVMQAIGGIMGWEVGLVWKADARSGILRCGELWNVASLETAEFKPFLRQMALERGLGLPGRVWTYGQAAWVADVAQDASFPRALSTPEGPLRSAYAFPILIGNNAVGVVEFLTLKITEEDNDLLLSLGNLGKQLGQFFERKRIESHLSQSQKMETVGRLAGGVAHDFNNLLTVIGGYCDLSMLKLPETDPVHGNITEIQRAAKRAGALTGQLLAFSRKQLLQPRVLSLNEVVRNMESMLRRLIGEDIDLSVALDSALGRVKADPGQIEQVIMNLTVNARDAMPRGGKLTISTTNIAIDQKTQLRNRSLDAGEYIMLAITDNGMGMSEEVQSHLFEPFFTTKGLGKGTGLGLATCHGIICQSGGDIRVYSEPNSGTTFKIYLPRTDAVAEGNGGHETKLLPKGRESILVVEDEPSVRKLAVLILRERGYKVQESNNAFEALELIRKNTPFDLVLTDVIMPQMSGKALYDQIKTQIPQTKVLLMSGYTDDALAHHGVLDEGLSFLEKPFSPSQLSRKVRDILDALPPERKNGH